MNFDMDLLHRKYGKIRFPLSHDEPNQSLHMHISSHCCRRNISLLIQCPLLSASTSQALGAKGKKHKHKPKRQHILPGN
jgi:hypothetical protein